MDEHRFPHRQPGGALYGVVFAFLLALPAAPTAAAAAIPSTDANGTSPETALIFYAQPQGNRDLWPQLFQILLDDLSAGDGDLPGGVALDKQPAILRGSDSLRGIAFPHIVLIKLLGRCDLPAQVGHPSGSGPLGWVLLVSGKVQPYIYIDCARIGQVLRPAIAGMNKQRRRDAMAQAICRVLIHEWVHVATQSSAHSTRGVTQAYLSIDDLIGSPKKWRLAASTR